MTEFESVNKYDPDLVERARAYLNRWEHSPETPSTAEKYSLAIARKVTEHPEQTERKMK